MQSTCTFALSFQAAVVLDDVDIVAHSGALLTLGDTARAAVAAIPVLPVIDAFISLTAPSPQVLQQAIVAAMGSLALSRPLPLPHVHTPHCEHAAPAASAQVSPAHVAAEAAAGVVGAPAERMSLIFSRG